MKLNRQDVKAANPNADSKAVNTILQLNWKSMDFGQKAPYKYL